MNSSKSITWKCRHTGTAIKEKPPAKYNVIILNDNYSTTVFVVSVLRTVFEMTEIDAISLMVKIHQHGSGVAGSYSEEIAEMKVIEVSEMAVSNGFPLLAIMEEE